MDNNAWWYVNGRWVHPHEATISLNHVAVLRGYSAFRVAGAVVIGNHFTWKNTSIACIAPRNS